MKYERIIGLCILALAAVYSLIFLTGCAATDGLNVSYTKDIGGQELTGFYAGGNYGIVGKVKPQK